MATISVSSGSYVRPRYAGKVRIKHYRVDESQTIRRGDLLVLVGDANQEDYVKKAGADPTNDREIVGFAAEAITTGASVTATDKIPVWLATGEAEFLVHVGDTQTVENSQVSSEFGVVNDATNNIWRLDTSETTAKVFRVLELIDEDGDTNGRLSVMVIAPERLYHD